LAIDGVESLNDAPVFREFAVTTPLPGETVVERMADDGFLAGIPLDAEYGDHGLLVTVTERRTRDEIDAFASAFEKVIR
jgi:glycine dehydrogenase subunit 1